MMNDLKTGLKLMRYTYGIKSNCIQAGVFLLAGLVMILSGDSGSFGSLGGFFWICIAMLPTQLIYSLSVSNLVQASPLKKKIQTIFPVAVNFACMIVVYLAELAINAFQTQMMPERSGEVCRNLVCLAGMMVLMMVYMGVCYKYFVVSTLCVVPFMVIWMQGVLGQWVYTGWLQLFGNWDISFGMAAGIGFGMLILGGLAEYLLTLLLYKMPPSKMAQAAPLRKEL